MKKYKLYKNWKLQNINYGKYLEVNDIWNREKKISINLLERLREMWGVADCNKYNGRMMMVMMI